MRVASCVLLACLLACSSSTSPTPPSDAALLFAREDFPSNWNLYQLNPGTGDVEPVDLSSGDDVYPSWFPDRERLAFISERDGSGIFVMDLDGQNLRRVYTDNSLGGGFRNLTDTRVAPDGSGIAFSFQESILLLLDLGDSSITNLGLGSDPAWSPDGQWIAFTSPGGIARIRPDSSDVTVLIPMPGASEPAYSPDGLRIAFTAPVGPALALFTARANGTEIKPLTQTKSQARAWRDLGAAWSPDGSWLAFQRDVHPACTGLVCIMAIPRSGGEVQRLTAGLRPAW
jgi:Tol biopolymer transport system component